MKPGTKAIIGYLGKRPARFTRLQWIDLMDDVAELGREKFLRLAVGRSGGGQVIRSPGKAEPADELLERMIRYRKKSGLDTRTFIAVSHASASSRLERQPSKAVMKSAPKYLGYLRHWLSADEIEAIFASVLTEHG